MERLGKFLKGQREKKGISLEEIASITKIQLRSLQLLEQDKWEELPPEPFIRGFVTAYAKCVGADLAEITQLVNETNPKQDASEVEIEKTRARLREPPLQQDFGKSFTFGRLMFAVVTVVGVLVAVYFVQVGVDK